MRHIIILFFFFLSFLNSSYAQKIRAFSDDDEKFLKELTTLIESGNKTLGKELMEEFSPAWEADSFSVDEKHSIKNTCSLLLKKRAKAYPHFHKYIESVLLFSREYFDVESYNVWQDYINYMCTNRKLSVRKVEIVLENTISLLKNQSVFTSKTTDWKYFGNGFKFRNPDDNLYAEFKNTSLVCYAKGDSSGIMNTKGVFDLLTQNWKGEGGKVLWTRAGFDETETFAVLKDYNIDMSKSSYSADSVLFTHKTFSSEPILGSLTEKIISDKDTSSARYPRFTSYKKQFVIENMYKNLNYVGGFSMHGARFIGSGNKEKNVSIQILYDGKPVFEAQAEDFIFDKEKISSQNTIITLHLDTDSIYHPGLSFRFDIPSRTVYLQRFGKGMSKNMYNNTYHKVDMDFEQFSWCIDHPKIEFSKFKGASEGRAFFESLNYFSYERYFAIKGLNESHPLVQVYKFAKKFEDYKFKDFAYADYLRMPPIQVKEQLLDLSYLGFLSYNLHTGNAQLREKALNYLRAASKRIDYDVINISSVVKDSSNAVLSLIDNNLRVFGVPTIQLSDSQNVVIYPKNEAFLLKRNRDMEFDGIIEAGKFAFYGKQLLFDYEDFNIKLNNIDSIRIWAGTREVDEYGNKLYRLVRTVLQDVTGELDIDYPNNKSGKDVYPEYPIFKSTRNSYVYYDSRRIQKGVYKRDNFYFQVNPFTIDSLDNFRTDGLKFDGIFASADIFPEFEESLTIQPDFSLGFVRKTPEQGFQTYKDKGVYKNEISMSHDGLRGNGELEYLVSITKSDDFIFFPDSMNTFAFSNEIEKRVAGTEYPHTIGSEVYVHWEPYADEMLISKVERPLDMYDSEAILHGTLKLEPFGLSGWGKMEFENAEMFSELYSYKSMDFKSDSASFNLLSDDELEEYLFKTTNVNSYITFQDRYGEFVSNDTMSVIEFPKNQYICYMDKFKWHMDEEEIDLGVSTQTLADRRAELQMSEEELEYSELDGAKFISVHPKQDSLQFLAPIANYKLKEFLITAMEVKLIHVADASVYPGNGEVVIERKAIMQPLDSAKIIANRDNRFHLIREATVNVFGRKSYKGKGYYDYIDELKRKQEIYFEEIAVDDSIHTFAIGSISDSVNFTLNPHFAFAGDVKLYASNEFLTFDGTTRISHECESLKRYWIKFKSEIDPLEVFIPIGEKIKTNGNASVRAGMMMNKDSTHVYSCFLTRAIRPDDIELISANGFMTYDNAEKAYVISSKEKIENWELPGNLISFNTKDCNVYAEGKIDVGMYFGQMKFDAAGNINHNLITDSVDLDLMVGWDFFFDKDLLKTITQSFIDDPYADAVDLSRETFYKGLAEFTDIEQADKIMNNLAMQGEWKRIPKELDFTMLLSDVYLRWNSSTNSYYSTDGIGIANINGTEVNRFVDAKLELTRRRSGNEFNMFLSTSESNWYFFSYRRNLMLVLSSNEEFNLQIINTKDNKRYNKEKGEAPFTYSICNERKKRTFVERFNERYDVPDELLEEEYDEEYDDENVE